MEVQLVDGVTGKPSSVPERLERLPVTPYRKRLFAVVAVAWLADQVDVALLAFLLPSLIIDFHLSVVQAALLAATTFAGQAVGNLGAGAFGDRLGRRPVLLGAMAVWGAASIAAACSWNLTMLMLCRFVIGIGVGGQAPVAQALLLEWMPARKRGTFVAWMEGGWALGYVVAGALSYTFLEVFKIGWRPVFALVAIGSLCALLVRRTLVESPRWLADAGRSSEAQSVLATFERDARARGYHTKIVFSFAARDERKAATSARGARLLFSRAYRERTLFACALWFFALLGFFGLTTWVTQILTGSGFSIAKSIGFTTVLSTGGIIGFLIAAPLLEVAGRRATLTVFLLMAALTAYQYGTARFTLVLFIAGFMMNVFLFGMWSCLYAYTPELFPTRARASGAGLASAAGRAGAIVGPVIAGVYVGSWHTGTLFSLGAISFAIAAFIVMVFGVETEGHVLEEISP